MLQLLNQYKIRLIELLLCVAIPVGLYYPALGFPAFSEDFSLLNGIRSSDLSKTNSLRYMGDVTLYLENLVFQDLYLIHHLMSVIGHGLTGFLSAVVSRTIFNQCFDLDPHRSRKAAYITAIFFLLYPFHLESVFWIAGRGVILASFFGLLSTHFFLRSNGKIRSYLFLSILFYALGLFCYESVILLPVLFFLIQAKRPFPTRIRVLSAYFIILFTYLLIGILLNKFSSAHKYYRFDLEFIRLVKNFTALHLRLFTVPFERSLYFILIGLLLISVQFLLLWRSFLKNRGLMNYVRGFAMLSFALLPFAWLGIDTHDFEGGRYLYFASIVYLVSLIGLLVKTLPTTALNFVFAFIFLYFFTFNRVVLHAWTFSAGMIEQALKTIPTASGPILVDNVPDSYQGVYIFRKGLDQAIIRYGNRLGNDQKNIRIQTVDWDRFTEFENRFKTLTELERSTYVNELRTLYRSKYPETPDSAITVYLFTSDGMLKLDNADGRFGD